ncbi:hypothetical protein GCM10011273_05220 [Asticcacaulis endophyticus]|uniref:Uncharacterized protein n=1 Tax=Asticcacaulis endophyticus TaxID=1395890 RepID=A0A918PV61_9CAUL|nr:hypothetical protein GCM10011273_05220 [Asticcacaulis endophyticus]
MVNVKKGGELDMTECMTLASHFKDLAKQGLVDVKFYVRNLDEAVSEQVCSEVNALYAARSAGKIKALNFEDSRRANT